MGMGGGKKPVDVEMIDEEEKIDMIGRNNMHLGGGGMMVPG